MGIDCRYRRLDPLGPSKPGGLQHFFLERYVLYASRRGQLVRGQVHHDPYPAYGAELISHSENLSTANGIPAEGAPAHVHASPGVDVEVFGIAPV